MGKTLFLWCITKRHFKKRSQWRFTNNHTDQMYSHEKQSVSPSISTAWFPQNQIAKPPGPFGLTEYVNLENGLMNQSSCQGVMLTVNVWRLKFVPNVTYHFQIISLLAALHTRRLRGRLLQPTRLPNGRPQLESQQRILLMTPREIGKFLNVFVVIKLGVFYRRPQDILSCFCELNSGCFFKETCCHFHLTFNPTKGVSVPKPKQRSGTKQKLKIQIKQM